MATITTTNLPCPEVELEVREAQHVGGLVTVRCSSQQRTKTREELGESERLREVVVCARVEPCDAAVDLGARREHQHGNRVAFGPEAPAYLEPVDPRHQHVEDRRVDRRSAAQPLERLLAVLGELDLVPLELERTPQRLANGTLVVDDEDLHGPHCALSPQREARVLATS